jgi:uncharacterized phage protein (TIGR02218 family)
LNSLFNLELSRFSSRPIELYHFSQKNQHWYFTSTASKQSFGGNVYVPETIASSNLEQKTDDGEGSIDITVSDSNPIALKFASGVPAAPIWVEITRIQKGTSEYQKYFRGQIALATFKGNSGEATLQCKPPLAALDFKIPRNLYQTFCNRVLYDERCGVNSAAFSCPATITDIQGDQLILPELAEYPDDWFALGYVQYQDTYRMIVGNSGKAVRVLAMATGWKAGTKVTVYAGCDHRKDTCRDKFKNLDNFLGWYTIPTKNPFEDGIG